MSRDGGGLPRWARGVLRAALPEDWRDDIVRDLDEAHARARPAGRIRSGIRVWGTVLVFVLRFLPIRLAELSTRSPTSLDLKLALRSLRGSPGLAALTIVALTLGIGATTAAFSFILGAFFTELPFPGGDRIHLVEDYDVTRSYALAVGGAEYLRRRDGVSSFEHLGAYHSQAVVVGGDRRVSARYVTPEILRLTGVQPLAGRLLDEDDAAAGAVPVVVLPHFLWVAETGADPGAVGSTIRVGGIDRTIVGVMPEGFAFPWGDELWVPLDPRSTTERLEVVGKLREGVDVETARAELAVVARPDPAELQSPDDEVTHLVTKLTRPVTGDEVLLVLAAPLVALLLVLAAMATNVATVVLARNARRSGELAVRVALGASRARVVGQLVLEVLLAVGVASVAGLALARWGLSLLENRFGLPFWVDFSLDPLAVAFTVALAGFVTLLAGLAPALRTTAGRLHECLKDGSRGSSGVRFGRFTDVFIAVELAICVGFLSAAAILGRSLLAYGSAGVTLPADEVLVANVYLGWPDELRNPDPGLSEAERSRRRREYLDGTVVTRRTLLDRLAEIPGVRDVAVGSRFPGDQSERTRVEVEGGRPGGPTEVEVARTGPGFFELLDARPVRGRGFTDPEHAGRGDVVLVDEPFVRAHLVGGGPGRRVRLIEDGPDGPEPGPWLEIVGVVPDLGMAVGDPRQTGTLYRPIEATTVFWVGLRGEGVPSARTPAVIEVARELDPGIRVGGSRSLADHMMLPVVIYRSLGAGFLALGAIALLLSAASLHALTACAVTRRTRELGIRRALGARAASLVARTATRAAGQVAVGGALGALLALGLLRLATIFPWRVGGGGVALLAGVPGLLVLAVAAALVGPLRRALSVRPAEALRHE